MLSNQIIKGGVLWETIDGTAYRTPPIPKDLTKVINYGLPKKEQIYRKRHLPRPENECMRVVNQELDKKGNPIRNLYNQQQLEYINTEFEIIYGKDDDPEDIGLWIYIGSHLTWICPWHYLLLEYWEITKANTKDKRAEYRDAQREDILIYWNDFRYDPQCLGTVKMKNRQDLATTLAQAMTFWFATRKPDQVCGQMADKDENTTKNFQQLLLVPFKRLPDWLTPIHTSSLTSEILSLSEPAQRTTSNNRMVRVSSALNSECNTRAATVKGYDSQRPDFLFVDEGGKMERFSVYQMLINQKPFLQRGFVRSGWSVVFTTVNEMNKGGAEFQKLWKASNRKDMGKNGQTKSGWKRRYRASYHGLEGFIGRYGESIIEKPNNDQWEFLQTQPLVGEDGKPIERERIGAKEYLERMRADLIDDEESYWTFVRNYSFNEDECFTSQNVDCHFSLTTLNNLIREHDALDAPLYQRGNFRFKDMAKTEVVFEPDENGRFWISWMPPTTELQNMVRLNGTEWEALNTTMGVIGVDPFSVAITSDGKGSHGAAIGKIFHDFHTERGNIDYKALHGQDKEGYHPTPGLFLMYHARPQSLTIFHEDMLMACHFYGVKMAFESNVNKIEAHFRARGYGSFILTKAELKDGLPSLVDHEKSGIPMTADLKQHGVDCIQTWLSGDGPHLRGTNYAIDVRRLPFRMLLEDMIKFKMSDSVKNDLTMALIIAHVAEWTMCDFSNPYLVHTSEASQLLPGFILEELDWLN